MVLPSGKRPAGAQVELAKNESLAERVSAADKAAASPAAPAPVGGWKTSVPAEAAGVVASREIVATPESSPVPPAAPPAATQPAAPATIATATNTVSTAEGEASRRYAYSVAQPSTTNYDALASQMTLASRGEPSTARFGLAGAPAAATALPPASRAAAPSAVNAPQSDGFRTLADEAKAKSQIELSAAGGEVAKYAETFKNLNQQSAGGAQPVLAAFALEQNGRSVRILDSDGSIYTGSVEADNSALADSPVPLKSPKDSDQKRGAPLMLKTSPPQGQGQGKELENAQNLNFQVSGLNRSLNQSLVFRGQLIVVNATNWLQNSQSQVFRNVQVQNAQNLSNQAPALQNNQAPASNLRVLGRARLGKAQEIQVEAVPAGQ
jgi:hypothetical protein